ncbi:MAG: hypothetical protein O7C59_03900 [Rickettsia endosymbiont of Ixodes persulcatus]|nr:hypothetical protein [Rickettsia endosymbiont of Ixodes persulcatus]MCZ6908374.1 hypothetical protein [Rickettsia endosymbiont of Ixodes persulcatus]MCZ6911127.1 hypothetical protein [Rickettsia endosymbiont of Ixodes persulcatus]MCZ6913696.1 hypothetical protein [Rickettsia endosymbiont of Ixodes persulcatus]MCZ6919442.1 hypothetical protein [Rickettsia endosymbiont of Ixodes persulcatus]
MNRKYLISLKTIMSLLNENISVIDWLKKQAEKETENTIRNMLRQVLFHSDEVNKNILSLSGGRVCKVITC